MFMAMSPLNIEIYYAPSTINNQVNWPRTAPPQHLQRSPNPPGTVETQPSGTIEGTVGPQCPATVALGAVGLQ